MCDKSGVDQTSVTNCYGVSGQAYVGVTAPFVRFSFSDRCGFPPRVDGTLLPNSDCTIDTGSPTTVSGIVYPGVNMEPYVPLSMANSTIVGLLTDLRHEMVH